MKTIPFVIVVIAATLVLAGCRSARSWPADGPPETLQEGNRNRVVLFAPLELGPLAATYPEARLKYARDLAVRLDLLFDNTQSWVGETLPPSDDPRWADGAVGAAAGAHVVVLTEVLEINQPKANPGFTPRVEALVRMRGINAKGEEIYRNELTGTVADETFGKLMHEGAKPQAKAVWEASKKLMVGLGNWVEQQPLPEPGDVWKPRDRDQAPLVDVMISSTPEGADIFVDGVFRGTTPSNVPIPVRELTLKLERQGYQVWERTFTPESNMSIAPGLEPLPGAGPTPQE